MKLSPVSRWLGSGRRVRPGWAAAAAASRGVGSRDVRALSFRQYFYVS